MNATHSLAANLGSLLISLAFVSLLAVGRAAVPAPVAPPHHPSEVHVFNGCHLSTLNYLGRFTAEFPAERGQPVIIPLRNGDGAMRSHTMALVTWHGTWWIRDEYFGTFSLKVSTAEADIASLAARAGRLYVRHAAVAVRAGTTRPPEPPAHFSASLRARDVTTAAAFLSVAHTIFWVKEGVREIPVIFFRPAAGVVAVYDPAHGSAVVECGSRDDATITTLIAGKLGYRVAGIRADVPALTGTLVAAATR